MPARQLASQKCCDGGFDSYVYFWYDDRLSDLLSGWWDLQGVEGMDKSRVSSDDRANVRYLANFCGNGHLACAWVSTPL